MNPFRYLKQHGIKYTANIFYEFKIPVIEHRLACLITRFFPTSNTIVIESHNDFDENSGAFYNYLIKHHYNNKYKIVWLLRHKVPDYLPNNVSAYPVHGPNFKRELIISRAKYILTAQDCIGSSRDDQVSIYLTHGGFGLKKWKGKINLPRNLSYTLMPSDYLIPLESYNYSIENTKVKPLVLGYPEDDMLYTPSRNELSKITKKSFSKVILWMPTFRKGGGRVDTTKSGGIGIPIFNTISEYTKLNKFLAENNALLVIKIHPMQEMSTVKIHSLSNIAVLDGMSVKRLGIDSYQLMKDTDALISDYSSSAYDYMHLNRPVGFTMDDVKDYKLGLIVDDPDEFIGGQVINNKVDFLNFVDDILNNKDRYKRKREEVFDKVFKYHDGNSCERLANFLNL